MSLILEALRKAEQERNRQGGPGLHAVQLAARRQGLPGWAVLIGVVLVANLLALGWLLLRPASQAPAVAAAPVPTAAPPITTPASPLPDPAQPGTPLPAAVAAAPAAAALDATPLPPEALEPIAAAGPATEPPPLRRPPATAVRPATAEPAERLPSAGDVSRNGTRLPALRLSLHVYDPDPALRYVLLNALQLHEGDVTPDGLRLERITETGVVLAWRGQRFTLQPGD